MRKRNWKKLNLHRETVRQLSPVLLEEAQGGAALAKWSEPPVCDPACTSATVSCTL
jgi:hypothetical protein